MMGVDMECVWCKSLIESGAFVYPYQGTNLHFCPNLCFHGWQWFQRQGWKFCNQCLKFSPNEGTIEVGSHKWFCCDEHRKEYSNVQTENVLP